jgi:hypothetical protein
VPENTIIRQNDKIVYGILQPAGVGLGESWAFVMPM